MLQDWETEAKVIDKKLLHSEILGIICCLIMIISVFLPWFELTGREYTYGMDQTILYFGYEGDPMFLLIFGIISMIIIYIGYMSNKNFFSAFGVLIFAILSIIVLEDLLTRMANSFEEYATNLGELDIFGEGSFVAGSYLGVIGALGLFFSSVWQIFQGYKYQKLERERPGKKNGKKLRKLSDRYCPDCGRNIPFNAIICPYCGKKFKDNFSIDEDVKTQKLAEAVEKSKLEEVEKWKEAD